MGIFTFSIESDVEEALEQLQETLRELEGEDLGAEVNRSLQAQASLMADAPPTSTGERQTNVTLNTKLGPIELRITTEPVAEYGGVGMRISGTPAHRANWKWIQTVDISGMEARTDFRPRAGTPTDPEPILGNESGQGQYILWDSPQFPAGTKKGWKHFVSSIGVYEDGEFQVLGSITWGFDVIEGQVKMMKPRASTRAERRGSLRFIRRDNPGLQLETDWIEEGQ